MINYVLRNSSRLLILLAFCLSFHTSHAQCALTDLEVTSECSSETMFSVSINFNFEGIGGLGFQVFGNGTNYGTFQYNNLPITIDDLFGNCETEYEFIVRDVLNPQCSTFEELGVVCCGEGCVVDIVDFTSTECEDDAFNLSFGVESQNVDDAEFEVSLNGTLVGSFPFGETVNLEELSNLEVGNNTITVCAESGECCDTYTFLNPCDCAISGVTADIIDCVSAEDSYYAIIDMDYVATNDSFQLGYSEGGINNFLGVHAYSDLPVVVGPIFFSNDPREILIVDQNDFFCFNSAYLGVVNDCIIQCQIFNLFAEAYECDNGGYFIDFEFGSEDIEGSTFDVIVDDEYYGSFPYGESSYTVGPIDHNCQEAPVLEIQDSQLGDDCSDFFIFDGPICCGDDCEFTVFEAGVECNDGDEIVIFAEYINPTADSEDNFFINFQGDIYGPYSSAENTATFSIANLANGTYPISIYVDGNEDCNAETQITVDCVVVEECNIEELVAIASECNDAFQVMVTISFIAEGQASDMFEIRGNGVIYGTFEYGSNEYTIGPLDADCETLYEFIIIDQGNPECTADTGFQEPLCCNECDIRDIEISDVECGENGIENFILNFIYEDVPSASFTLTIDGLTSDKTFQYDDLPLSIAGEFGASIVLVVTDLENENCSETIAFDSDCEDALPCVLDEGVLTFIECDETTYSLSLDMFYQSSGESFIVTYGEGLSLTFNYADLPVTIPNLSVGVDYTFVISDLETEDCSIQRSYILEECVTSTNDKEWEKLIVENNINLFKFYNNFENEIIVGIYATTGELLNQQTVRQNATYMIDNTQLNTGLYFIVLSSEQSNKTYKFLALD